MTSFWGAVHRLATSAWLQFFVGALVACSGAIELYHFGIEEGREMISHAEYAVIFLGLLTALVAVEHILLGLKLSGTVFLGQHRSGENQVATVSRRVLHHPWFELLLGLLIFTAGVTEAWEDVEVVATAPPEQIWHFGLILLGLLGIARGLAATVKSIVLVEEAEEESGWHLRFVHRVDDVLRNPRTEIAVALVLITLGVWEEVVFAQDGYGYWIKSHFGLVIFAVNTLGLYLPSVLFGAQLAEDAHRPRPAAQPVSDRALRPAVR